MGSNQHRRFSERSEHQLHHSPIIKIKCTSTGFEPARLSATFLQDLVWNSTIRVIACFTRHSCRYASTYSATSALKFSIFIIHPAIAILIINITWIAVRMSLPFSNFYLELAHVLSYEDSHISFATFKWQLLV